MTYGLGTRSYNRSSECREIKQQRANATRVFEAGPRTVIWWPVACTCSALPFPHLHDSQKVREEPAVMTPARENYTVKCARSVQSGLWEGVG
jgi:hypothetical protein